MAEHGEKLFNAYVKHYFKSTPHKPQWLGLSHLGKTVWNKIAVEFLDTLSDDDIREVSPCPPVDPPPQKAIPDAFAGLYKNATVQATTANLQDWRRKIEIEKARFLQGHNTRKTDYLKQAFVQPPMGDIFEMTDTQLDEYVELANENEPEF